MLWPHLDNDKHCICDDLGVDLFLGVVLNCVLSPDSTFLLTNERMYSITGVAVSVSSILISKGPRTGSSE